MTTKFMRVTLCEFDKARSERNPGPFPKMRNMPANCTTLVIYYGNLETGEAPNIDSCVFFC